ncbi:MAG: protein kinase [Nocardiopsaceae bacterium]|nr:protein kinase [Nocardiopsaceae bacterium]
MPPMPLQQGDPPQIGRYRLTARLGSGGMGVVYLGQAADGQQVAVKVLRPEYADDQEFRARFQREVVAMARVRNRYTVRVLDADTRSAKPFLATDFAEGPSLDEHVGAHGPLHEEAVYRLAAALAEAIAAIHAAGVSHRDLKPSNVLLTDSGPKVIDFGIAQVADTVSITRTGMAVGSPGYMAPEQVMGRAGQEADIFTWALIVAFAASGRRPFGDGQSVAIMHRIVSDEPDISAVPPQLMPLVQAALAKEPGNRPAATDLLRELAPDALGEIAQQTAVDPGMTPRTALDAQSPPTVRDNYRPDPERTRTLPPDPESTRGMASEGNPRRWRGALIAAAVAVVVLAVVGFALLSNLGSHPLKNTSNNSKPPASAKATTGGGGPVSHTEAPTTQPAVQPSTQPATSQAPSSPATSGPAPGGGNSAPATTGSTTGLPTGTSSPNIGTSISPSG